MKVFGYLDDLLVWFFNWQVSMGWWNFIVIPLELFMIYLIKLKLSVRMITYQ